MGVEIGPEPRTLEAQLKVRSIVGGMPLVAPVAGKPDWVRCLACGHRCRIPPGRPGICKVRFNENGRLLVPFGYVGNAAVDPVEKKPFFHVLPGSAAMSFGMLGCDLHCPFCQNWFSSQALRDTTSGHRPQDITAETLLEIARDSGSRLVVSTYNEPLITTEWAMAIFRRAKEESFVTGYVSNGNATPEVLDVLRPVTDLFKVDLKCFDDKAYRSVGAVLANVLETLEQLRMRGFWVEVVTLLVPGFNDSEAELRALTRWLARLDPMIPWHVTAFHPDYKMSSTHPTSWNALRRATEIGVESGIRYVYAGNLPGDVGEWENTRCHSCGETVIRRYSFRVTENRLDHNGTCPECGTHVPGVWG